MSFRCFADIGLTRTNLVLATTTKVIDMNSENNLAETLANSEIYQDYERAFSETTGLPVALRPVESWQLPHHGRRKENPFCAFMAQKSRSCAACLQTQQKLAERAREEAQSVVCAHGMTDTAVHPSTEISYARPYSRTAPS